MLAYALFEESACGVSRPRCSSPLRPATAEPQMIWNFGGGQARAYPRGTLSAARVVAVAVTRACRSAHGTSVEWSDGRPANGRSQIPTLSGALHGQIWPRFLSARNFAEPGSAKHAAGRLRRTETNHGRYA
jgi:hypothetical protein